MGAARVSEGRAVLAGGARSLAEAAGRWVEEGGADGCGLWGAGASWAAGGEAGLEAGLVEAMEAAGVSLTAGQRR